jgi:hypothetical protein
LRCACAVATGYYYHTVAHHILEFEPKFPVLGNGEKPGLDGNLIIEGDKLRAVRLLLPSHAGRINCIYIDLPYNTDSESGRKVRPMLVPFTLK